MASATPPVEMETTRCAVCGSAAAKTLFQRADLGTNQPGVFQVVACQACGHHYLNPRPTPEAIGFYYPDSYSPYNNPHPADIRSPWGYWLVTRPVDLRCRIVSKYRRGGRILDVGCSTGQFLGRLAQFGEWERFGLELNPLAAAIARQRYQISVTAGQLDALRFASDSLDVVTLWDVIEHLHQPKELLAELNRIIAPNGYLILSTPMLDSLEARLFGKYWVGYELPRHLNIFSRAALGRLLAQAGFAVRESRVVTGGSYAWLDSLSFWSQAADLSPFWQTFFQQTLRRRRFLFASAPLFKVLDRLEFSSPLTMVCQKVTQSA